MTHSPALEVGRHCHCKKYFPLYTEPESILTYSRQSCHFPYKFTFQVHITKSCNTSFNIILQFLLRFPNNLLHSSSSICCSSHISLSPYCTYLNPEDAGRIFSERVVTIPVNRVIFRNRGNFTLCFDWTATMSNNNDEDDSGDVAQSWFPPWPTSTSPMLRHLGVVHRVLGSLSVTEGIYAKNRGTNKTLGSLIKSHQYHIRCWNVCLPDRMHSGYMRKALLLNLWISSCEVVKIQSTEMCFINSTSKTYPQIKGTSCIRKVGG